MDAKTITEKSKALVKATSSGEAPSIILGILNELKTGIVANEDILRSTRIGVTVNKSKQHKNPEVARLAGEIVRKWRDDIQKLKPSSPNGKKSTATPPGTASPAPIQKKVQVSMGKPPLPDVRTWKKDGVEISRTGQATRDNCIGLTYDGLAVLSQVPSQKILSVAVAVEAAAFKAFGPEDREIYKAKMRSLYQNLKSKSNPALRIQVLSGEIKPERFVTMSSDELKSEELREEVRRINKDNLKNSQVPTAERSISTSLTCGKCGQKKVSYSQAQTRSADEPMTTFCVCLNCENRWKFS